MVVVLPEEYQNYEPTGEDGEINRIFDGKYRLEDYAVAGPSEFPGYAAQYEEYFEENRKRFGLE